jgi:hypothetical protein
LILVGRIIANSQFDRKNLETKRSDNLGLSFTGPYYFFSRDQGGLSFGGGVCNYNTMFYGTNHSRGHNNEIIDTIKTILSTDNGTSWSSLRPAIYHDDGNYWFTFAFSQGRVHLVYQETSSISNFIEIYYVYSDDWGESWSDSQVISDDAIDGSQWPSISASSEGNLIITWFDYKYGSGHGGFTGDLLFRVSIDNGSSWGSEQRLTNNQEATASMAFFTGNNVGIVWQDHTEGYFESELLFAQSTDAGQTWGDSFRLTNSEGMSEYQHLAFVNNKLYLVWGDARNNPPFDCDVFFRLADDVVGVEDDISPTLPANIDLVAYPNPFNSNLTISVESQTAGLLSICDIQGRIIRQFSYERGEHRIVWDATNEDNKPVTSGTYFIGRKGDEKNILKVVYLK